MLKVSNIKKIGGGDLLKLCSDSVLRSLNIFVLNFRPNVFQHRHPELVSGSNAKRTTERFFAFAQNDGDNQTYRHTEALAEVSYKQNSNKRFFSRQLPQNDYTSALALNGTPLRSRPLFVQAQNDHIRPKAAFTLAEVLITLGIIGVVAAMTIPALTTKIQNKQYQVAYRKAYSTLNQALKSMLEDGKFIDISNPGSVYQADGPIGENFKILATYFSGATYCFEKNADKCWNCNGESGHSMVNNNNGRGCMKDRPAFIDASGMSYYIYSGSEWPILVDVNGMSGPNKFGRDRYVMYFTNSRTKGKYDSDVDTIYPWSDITKKQRWCPSGDCPNTSRLFGNGGNTYNIDMDNPDE